MVAVPRLRGGGEISDNRMDEERGAAGAAGGYACDEQGASHLPHPPLAQAQGAPSPDPKRDVSRFGARNGEVGNTRLRVGEGESARIDWAEVRRVYELRQEPVTRILARFGLKPSELRKVREREDWEDRPAVGVPLRLTAGQVNEVAALGTRLLRNYRAQLGRLDRNVALHEAPSDLDARALAELTRGWGYMRHTIRRGGAAKAAQAADGLTKKNNDAGSDLDAELARRRAELKRRLDELREPSRHGGSGRDHQGS